MLGLRLLLPPKLLPPPIIYCRRHGFRRFASSISPMLLDFLSRFDFQRFSPRFAFDFRRFSLMPPLSRCALSVSLPPISLAFAFSHYISSFSFFIAAAAAWLRQPPFRRFRQPCDASLRRFLIDTLSRHFSSMPIFFLFRRRRCFAADWLDFGLYTAAAITPVFDFLHFRRRLMPYFRYAMLPPLSPPFHFFHCIEAFIFIFGRRHYADDAFADFSCHSFRAPRLILLADCCWLLLSSRY